LLDGKRIVARSPLNLNRGLPGGTSQIALRPGLSLRSVGTEPAVLRFYKHQSPLGCYARKETPDLVDEAKLGFAGGSTS
jgi:hypothetical protein